MTELEKYVNAPNFIRLKEHDTYFEIVLKADAMCTPDGDYIYISYQENRIVPSEFYVFAVQKVDCFQEK
jgi:hypothetical protein